MTDTQAQKEFTLYSNWKYFFFSYLISVLTIPLVGIGIIALYHLRKKRYACRYVMRNDQITSIDQEYEQNVDLADIKEVVLRQNRFQEILGIGTLVLINMSSNLEITGISNPVNIKDILERAIMIQTKQKEVQDEAAKNEPSYKPGALEKINYLTGLWQQGLLSDQDYQEQRQQLE